MATLSFYSATDMNNISIFYGTVTHLFKLMILIKNLCRYL